MLTRPQADFVEAYFERLSTDHAGQRLGMSKDQAREAMAHPEVQEVVKAGMRILLDDIASCGLTLHRLPDQETNRPSRFVLKVVRSDD